MTKCPNCGYYRVYKYGKRINKRGTFQKYKCRNCKRQFIDDDFLWMQTTKEVVSTALRLFTKSSMSKEDILEELEKIFGVVRSVGSLYYWKEKFLPLFVAINSLPHSGLSESLRFDYTYVKNVKIYGENVYFWTMRCPVTKVIVGWLLSTSRKIEDAKKAFRAAKRRFSVGYWPGEIVTDKEPSFPRAIWEVFNHRVKHYQYKGFVDEKNNNAMETVYRFKKRMPEFRSFREAYGFFQMWVARYNIKRSKKLADSEQAYELRKTLIFQRSLPFNF